MSLKYEPSSEQLHISEKGIKLKCSGNARRASKDGGAAVEALLSWGRQPWAIGELDRSRAGGGGLVALPDWVRYLEPCESCCSEAALFYRHLLTHTVSSERCTDSELMSRQSRSKGNPLLLKLTEVPLLL